MNEIQRVYWRNVGVGSVLVAREPGETAYDEHELGGGFLVDWAEGMAKNPCPDGDEGCEVCQLSEWAWWQDYATRPRYIKMAVQRALLRHGIPLPTNPRERVVG